MFRLIGFGGHLGFWIYVFCCVFFSASVGGGGCGLLLACCSYASCAPWALWNRVPPSPIHSSAMIRGFPRMRVSRSLGGGGGRENKDLSRLWHTRYRVPLFGECQNIQEQQVQLLQPQQRRHKAESKPLRTPNHINVGRIGSCGFGSQVTAADRLKQSTVLAREGAWDSENRLTSSRCCSESLNPEAPAQVSSSPLPPPCPRLPPPCPLPAPSLLPPPPLSPPQKKT